MNEVEGYARKTEEELCNGLDSTVFTSEQGQKMVDTFKLLYGIAITDKLGTYFDIEKAKKETKKFLSKPI